MPRFRLLCASPDPDAFAREMRIAGAIQMYAQARLSQAKAAEVAGFSRAAFIQASFTAWVSPFQVSGDSLREELADAD